MLTLPLLLQLLAEDVLWKYCGRSTGLENAIEECCVDCLPSAKRNMVCDMV